MSRTARADLRPIREPVHIPEPEHDVALALKELMHSLRQTVESEMRAHGETLTFAHGMLLSKVLVREPGISGAQAARRAQVTAQTMNGLLRSLEAEGCVVREGNPENQRADRWFLTQEGVRRLEQAKIIADSVVRRMMAPLTERDAEHLCELLQKCAVGLRSAGPAEAGHPSRPAKSAASRAR
jgi:DNA-binding MarR family transcriptional regulator